MEFIRKSKWLSKNLYFSWVELQTYLVSRFKSLRMSHIRAWERERQREIERQRERDRDRERQRQREREERERERERKLSKLFHAAISLAAWKVSKYGVFYGTHFPVCGLNTGKYRPEKAPYLDNFQTVYAWLAQIKKVKTVLGNKKYCN